MFNLNVENIVYILLFKIIRPFIDIRTEVLTINIVMKQIENPLHSFIHLNYKFKFPNFQTFKLKFLI